MRVDSFTAGAQSWSLLSIRSSVRKSDPTGELSDPIEESVDETDLDRMMNRLSDPIEESVVPAPGQASLSPYADLAATAGVDSSVNESVLVIDVTNSSNTTLENVSAVNLTADLANTTAWALVVQEELEAARNETGSGCDCTPAPPAPYSDVNATPAPIVEPVEELTAAEEEAVNATREAAMPDCSVADWGEWSDCVVEPTGTYKSRVEIRERHVINPQADGGAPCPPLTQQSQCSGEGFITGVVNVQSNGLFR